MPPYEKDERSRPVRGVGTCELELCGRLVPLTGESVPLLSSPVRSTVSTRLRLPVWSGVFALLTFEMMAPFSVSSHHQEILGQVEMLSQWKTRDGRQVG